MYSSKMKGLQIESWAQASKSCASFWFFYFYDFELELAQQ